jgi:hypothetical protein
MYSDYAGLKLTGNTQRLLEWTERRRHVWPAFFTLLLCAAFGPPVIVCAEVLRSPTALYWLPGYPWLICLVPVSLLAGHLLHMRAGRPRLLATLFSTAVPSLCVLLVGRSMRLPLDTPTILWSTDCITHDAKVQLELAWQSAEQYFNACVRRVAAETNSTTAAAAQLLTVADCSEYRSAADASQYVKQWDYLSVLEQRQDCSGWCTVGAPKLWSSDHLPSKDICSSAAALELNEIDHWCLQMQVVGLLLLTVSLLMASWAGQRLREAGYEWN